MPELVEELDVSGFNSRRDFTINVNELLFMNLFILVVICIN